MCPAVRANFSEVEQLLRILLVLCPASSCTAERSFSAQRRLRNWLRNNYDAKPRLNAVAVCNVRKVLVDDVNLHKLAADFAEVDPKCAEIFSPIGSITFSSAFSCVFALYYKCIYVIM